MNKLTKYQKKLVKILMTKDSEVIKFPSDRFYLLTYKRNKEIKTLLRDSVVSMIIESSSSYTINEKKGIFGLTFNRYDFADYCQNNNLQHP